MSDVEQSDVNDIFGDASAEEEEVSGIKMLMDKSSESQTKLPMLEVIYDRLVRFLSISYRTYTSFTVDVESNGIVSTRFGDYIESLPIPSMIAVVKSIEWDNFLLITVDSKLTYSLVDILFGGRKIDSEIRVEGRPYTSIEQNVVQNIVDLLLRDLSNSFESITPVSFHLDRLESNPKFATIARPEDVVIILNLVVKMESRSGKIQLVMPYGTIEPIKKLLQKTFLGEKASKDPIWARNLEESIASVNVEVTARLNGVSSTIKNLASLNVGDTIVVDKEPDEDVFVSIDKQNICTGKIGKFDDKVAIKLSNKVNLKKYKV